MRNGLVKKEKDKVASDGMGTMHVNPHHTHILALQCGV